MNGIMGNVKPGRSLRLIAATVAIVIAGLSGTASAVNPHRPIITSMTPNYGPIAGGTTVTIEGSNFKPPMTATFAGVAATGCTTPTGPAGDQTFTCVTPASSVLGLVPVTIKNRQPGNSGTLVVPNGVDTTFFVPDASRPQVPGRVVFVGPTYLFANRDGVDYLLEAIWPLVRSAQAALPRVAEPGAERAER